MKKYLVGSLLVGILVFAFAIGVSASSYTSTLSLGEGRSVFGASRYFTKGENKIRIDIDWMQTDDYQKLFTSLNQDNGNSSLLLGNFIFSFEGLICLEHNFGMQNASNKYYYFSTKVNGISYGGIKSNYVKMSS